MSAKGYSEKQTKDATLLVFDIGGTFIKYACMDAHAQVLAQGKTHTPQSDQAALLTLMHQILQQFHHVDGIAISLPGVVDEEKRYLYTGGKLQYNAGCYFGDIVEKKLQLPVALANDATCALLAEKWKGNLKGVRNGGVLVFGTSVGGAFFVEDTIIKGAHLMGGEVSLMMKQDETATKQSFFGYSGSVVLMMEELKQIFGENDIIWSMLPKHAAANEIFQRYVNSIAWHIYNIQCILDLQRICIGGGISAQPVFIAAIQTAVEDIYQKVPFPIPMCEIIPCKFYNDANMIGAYFHYQQTQKKEVSTYA